MDPQTAASTLVRMPPCGRVCTSSVSLLGRTTKPGTPPCARTGVGIANAKQADDLIRRARVHVEHGPPPRPREQIDSQRYHLTSAVDDLLGCPDAGERVFIAGQVAEMTGQLALAHRDAWSGSGKWLYRWLEAVDLGLAKRLSQGCRLAVNSADVTALGQVATEVLAAAGGPLQEGYRLS